MTTTIERQIIIGAMRLLDSPEKWCKGALEQTGPNGQRQFCIRGAIYAASKAMGLSYGQNGEWCNHTGKADRLVAKAYDGGSSYAHVDFQNDPDTTFDQMRSLLQKALTI